MKKQGLFLLVLSSFLLVSELFSKTMIQQQSKSTSTVQQKTNDKPDTIVKLGGKKILCSINKINSVSVLYNLIGKTEELQMSRKEIEKVIFRNGRKEVYNKPVLTMIDKDNWQSVLITEKEGDVDGLYKKAAVKANAASGSRSGEAAKASATIRMQKKAAGMGALIVLITHSQMRGGYGETPGWELEGIAYSDTPPQDTASVNKAIREMLDRNKTKREKVEIGARNKEPRVKTLFE